MIDGDGRLFLVRVQSRVNAPLNQTAMRRFRFREVGDLGRFLQAGMGLEMEARVYRPAGEP